MKDILQDIIANKREEVARQKQTVSQQILEQQCAILPACIRSMKAALATSASGIIAEFKRRSPSKGWLKAGADVADIVPAYEKAGAAACSILTDTLFFGGTMEDLRKARSLVDLPLLRKDFIIDEYQLYEARLIGADAVLLIAACLSPGECRQLARTAHSLGLEVLLEIHSEAELTNLNPDIDMVGVNNRNLGTFHTDIGNSFRLAGLLREQTASSGHAPLLVAESGISAPAIVRELRQEGFRGFLIGETFMKTPLPGNTLSDFIKEIQ